jgi:excisionase family DNA binding protein
MTDELEPTHTAAEAAEILRVSAETVRNLCREERLGHFKIGPQYFIPDSDLRAYRQRCYVPAAV